MTNAELIRTISTYSYDQKVELARTCYNKLLELAGKMPGITDSGYDFATSYVGGVLRTEKLYSRSNYDFLKRKFMNDALGYLMIDRTFDCDMKIQYYCSSKWLLRDYEDGVEFRKITRNITAEYKNYMLNFAFVIFLASKSDVNRNELEFIHNALYI